MNEQPIGFIARMSRIFVPTSQFRQQPR